MTLKTWGGGGRGTAFIINITRKEPVPEKKKYSSVFLVSKENKKAYNTFFFVENQKNCSQLSIHLSLIYSIK